MLKPNEQALLDYIVKQKTPIEQSAQQIAPKVKFSKKLIIRKRQYYTPSRVSITNVLHALQKKGFITLDYSAIQKPRIILNK